MSGSVVALANSGEFLKERPLPLGDFAISPRNRNQRYCEKYLDDVRGIPESLKILQNPFVSGSQGFAKPPSLALRGGALLYFLKESLFSAVEKLFFLRYSKVGKRVLIWHVFLFPSPSARSLQEALTELSPCHPLTSA